MKNIVVVEAISTGVNLITDIVHRGFKPFVLEPSMTESKDIAAMRRSSYASVRDPFEIISEKDTYEETLEMVRELNPVIVLPGSESGVELANRLASDLGLLGNPVENIDKMTKKSAMHEALKEAGIRYIKGQVVTNAEDALKFCRENGFETAVVKPVHGAGSVGLYLCDNLDEVEAAVNELTKVKDFFGGENSSVLIQERIFGTEYIVNTMSCAGQHRLSSVWKYKKVKTEEGGYIYDNCSSIYELEPGHTALIEYAFQVCEAIGIQYGPIHGEYMIDERGPILIEVNCRPMGANMPAEYLDLINGHHETDFDLDCYLAPEKFRAEANKAYRSLRQGYIKFVKVPEAMDVESLPIWVIAENLRSTYKIAMEDRLSVTSFTKTRDLETAGGAVYLVHDDRQVVDHDIRILSMIEERYFELILNSGMSRRWFARDDEEEFDFGDIISRAGSTLLVSDRDEEIDRAVVASAEDAALMNGSFEQVIIDIKDGFIEMNEVECIELLFRLFRKVKEGGRVIVHESTYCYLSYGRETVELIMYVLGYKIEAPLSGWNDLVIGTRY